MRSHYFNSYPFPDPAESPGDSPLAIGGDLCAGRLISAYTQGIFPWYNPGEPILWWSPDPRCVLYPEGFRLSHSLRKTLKRGDLEIVADRAFEEVMQACAEAPRRGQNGTWITEDMLTAYTELHRLGIAHSIEVWREGRLVGGLYGLSIGAAFFGESMFHRERDASKVAFAKLVELAHAWDFHFIDCQVHNKHLESLGAVEIDRADYLEELEAALDGPTLRGPWVID